MIGSRVKRQEFPLYDTSGSNRHQPPSYYSDWCLIYSKRNWSSLDARSGRCCWSRLKRKNQTVVYFIWKQKNKSCGFDDETRSHRAKSHWLDFLASFPCLFVRSTVNIKLPSFSLSLSIYLLFLLSLWCLRHNSSSCLCLLLLLSLSLLDTPTHAGRPVTMGG